MPRIERIVTVGLNPAIDRIIEVPNFEVGGHQRGQQRSRYPAGKALNVAKALAALDRPSIITGFVGEADAWEFERFITGMPHRRATSQLLHVAERTRENITVVDPETHVETHIRDAGFTVTDRDIDRMTSKLGLLARPGTLMAFCGSLPPGLAPATFGRLVRACLDAGAAVAMDTSGDALSAIKGLPLWLIKPNAGELGTLVGRKLTGEAQIAEAAAEVAQTASMVLVSLGPSGARLVTGDQPLTATVDEPVEVANTVGCGDCLLAGFIDGWLAEGDPESALRRGGAAATANAVALATGTFTEVDVSQFADITSTRKWTDAE